MEQVLAPRFEFKPKNPASGPVEGFDYGEGGYDPNKCNVGFNEETGYFQIEIKGLAEPKSKEAARICQEDLNEVIAAFVQDRTAIERGLFDEELVPEELTQVRMGKIIKDKYPDLDEEDQDAVRQHAVAALNLTQKAKEIAAGGVDGDKSPNTAFIEGVRRFAMDVRDLDIDLIDHINPFGEAYAILAKTMSEESLKQVAAVIAGKRVNLTMEEARDLAKRALRFKQERGRLPSITSPDAWEKRMAEGVAFLARMKVEAARNSPMTMTRCSKNSVSRSRRRRTRAGRPARSGSSPGSRRFSVSSSSTAAPRSMEKAATFSSGSLPCASIVSASWTSAACCLIPSIIRDFCQTKNPS
jgi:hypothetical protein